MTTSTLLTNALVDLRARRDRLDAAIRALEPLVAADERPEAPPAVARTPRKPSPPLPVERAPSRRRATAGSVQRDHAILTALGRQRTAGVVATEIGVPVEKVWSRLQRLCATGQVKRDGKTYSRTSSPASKAATTVAAAKPKAPEAALETVWNGRKDDASLVGDLPRRERL